MDRLSAKGQRNASKKVAVTGGAGFIGSHLAGLLVERGYRVIILDNLCTGKLANLESIFKKPCVEFIQESILNLPLLQTLFHGVEYVFHQAAVPSVPRSIEDPETSHNVNVTGTLNVLLAARDNNVRKVIYASSSSVYGDTPVLPKVEDMATSPLSPYAVSKLAGEHYCRVFQQVYGMPTVCLRYFNVYGPRQDPESQYAAAIPKFITRIAQKTPPVIFGDGEQSRDFTFIRDVAEANVQAAESDVTGIFNISRGEWVTINHLVQLITGLMGSEDIRPVYEESRAGDVKHSLADILKAKNFGYNPKYSLEEGLKETIINLACKG
ncbi:SDR family oxidoreductase [Chloroflexota bacterium]